MEKIKTLLKKLRKGWLLMVFLLFFIVIGGQSAKLTCEHDPSGTTANCTKESRLFWVIPLGTRSIQDVQGAQITETYDDNAGTVYRVELLTAQGTIPLNPVYTSGYSTKSEVTEEINTFVNQTGENYLVVTEPGLLSLENFMCMAIWLPIGLLLSFIWGRIKSAFGHKKDKSIKAV